MYLSSKRVNTYSTEFKSTKSAGLNTAIAQLTYVGNGDDQGVLYYLGTNERTTVWSNPTPTKTAITITNRNTAGGEGLVLSDRLASSSVNADNALAEPVSGVGIITIDLGSQRTLICDKYSLRHRSNFTDDYLRTWKLQGSNNNTTWLDIDTRTSDTSIAAAAQWATSTCNNGNTTAYRYFRIACTATSGSNGARVFLFEWEFYGTLYTVAV